MVSWEGHEEAALVMNWVVSTSLCIFLQLSYQAVMYLYKFVKVIGEMPNFHSLPEVLVGFLGLVVDHIKLLVILALKALAHHHFCTIDAVWAVRSTLFPEVDDLFLNFPDIEEVVAFLTMLLNSNLHPFLCSLGGVHRVIWKN